MDRKKENRPTVRKKPTLRQLLLRLLALLLGFLLPQLSGEGNTPVPEGTLEVHFIDVGQGDAALLLCGGDAMLIDGGRSAESGKLYTYLKNQGVQHLDYLVATHADADHVGGLSGALNYAAADTAYCSVTEDNSKAFQNLIKTLDKQGKRLEIPHAGDSFPLGTAKVTVLGPLRSYENDNDGSLVLRVSFGKTAFLFMGDAEYAAETELAASGAELSATVLKVSHHGSSSGTGSALLSAAKPKYAVISVGKDNSYGHPSASAVERLEKAGAEILRTDRRGTLIFVSDGESVSFTAEREDTEAESAQLAEPPVTGQYVGNLNSWVFHRSSCPSLPAERNRIYFETREEAEQAGYTPCGRCKP